MRYNRLKRTIVVDIGGKEYSFKLTIDDLAELEDSLQDNERIISMFTSRTLPKIKTLIKAFTLGLKANMPDIEKKELFEKFCAETSIDEVTKLYFSLIAVSNLLGESVSNEVLKNLGYEVKDEENAEKNA